VATALCLAATLVVSLCAQVFPSFLTRLSGSSGEQGLLLFSMFLLYPVSSLASGVVADRLGKRGVMTAGLLLVAAPFALSAAVPDIRVRTLAMLLFGLGEGVVETQVSALISDLSPARERAMLNLAQLLFSLGAAGGPFLLALLFLLPTGATIGAVLWGCAAACAAPAAVFAALTGAGGPLREPRRPVPAKGQSFRLTPALGLLAAGVFVYVAAEMGTASWLAKYGEVHLGLAPEMAPVCITAFWGGLSASRLLTGFLSARVPDRAILYSSLLFTFAGQIFSFTVANPAAAIVGFALTGIGMGPIWATLVAMAGRWYRESSGTAIGLLVASGGASAALIQAAMGWLSAPQRLGLRLTLLALSAFTAANLLIVRQVLRGRPSPARA
jgi:fucose permease